MRADTDPSIADGGFGRCEFSRQRSYLTCFGSRDRCDLFRRELAHDFTECLDPGRFRDAVLAEQREGREAGVRATPTFFINQRKIEGALPLEEFRDAIKQALRDAGR